LEKGGLKSLGEEGGKRKFRKKKRTPILITIPERKKRGNEKARYEGFELA